MDITIQNINKVVSYTNLVVSKINPYAGVVTSEAAVITQIGTTSVTVVNQTSQGQAELFDINFSVDASVIALTAKVDGFLLALGTAAIYGSGATLAAGTILTTGSLMFMLSVTAGVVAATANQSVRDIITDPQFWDSMKNDGLNGLDNYVKARSGISLSDLLDKLVEGMLTGEMSEFSHAISETTATNFNSAGAWRQPVYDPLTLDLDGDGLETVGTAAGILFDHDGDGIKQGTGWVKADDGLLVLDRNSNGQVDNGAELFGVDFVKQNGQKATDGFDALRDLDSNGDGQFNADDAQFAAVRVWRDLNQDGISQANELQGLTEAGIASISLNAATTTTNLGNGNSLSHSASFTRNDGTTGIAANLNFATDVFHRQFTDHLDTRAVANLPDMQGSGAVRDLREAASQSPALATTLSQLGSGTTRAELKAAITVILQQWADSADFTDSFEAAAAQNKDLFFVPPGVSALDAYNAHYQGLLGTYYASTGGGSAGSTPLTNAQLANYAAIRTQQANIERMLKTLEAFNGRDFVPVANSTGSSTLISFAATAPGGTSGGVGITAPVMYSMEQGRFDLLQQSYNQLVDSVYGALVTQTRLKPYLDAISLRIDDSGIDLDFTAMDALLETKQQTDPKNGLTVLIELQRFTGAKLNQSGWDGLSKIQNLISTMPINDVYGVLDELQMSASGNFNGTVVNDFIFGKGSADSLNGNTGDDVLFGLDGDDNLMGGGGKDRLFGGNGNDILTLSGSGSTGVLDGGDGNDTLTLNQETGGTLRGGAGDDTLTESYWTYGSVFEGGIGNDTLTGGHHADTYLFNLGDGHDRISDNQWYTQTGINDRLVFGAGIMAGDLQLLRTGNDLVFKHSNGSDSVTITNWFLGTSYRIERIEFADGLLWTPADIKLKNITMTGTAGADVLTGTEGKTLIYGLDGNDTLSLSNSGSTGLLDGGNGNDTLTMNQETGGTLRGGAGDDTLTESYWTYGSVFEGGIGNDTLTGGHHADTYLFKLGDGHDRISDNQWYTQAGVNDRLVFGAGIMAGDLQLLRTGNDLVLKHSNGLDSVTITNWFAGASYRIERIEFADGTMLGSSDIQIGSVNSDGITGTSDDSVLIGNEESDFLNGGLGNDWLNGGTGNDQLTGGSGSDTYLYGRSYGTDTIVENDAAAGNTDAVKFLADIAADQLWFQHVGNNLDVSIIGTSDKLVVKDWYLGSANHVEQFKTADGKTLLDSQVDNLVSAMAAFAPPAAGQTTLPADYQSTLTPVIAANWQ